MKEFNHTTPEDLRQANIAFDYAVPLDFQQEIYDLCGHNMNGHIVTAYLKGYTFGTFIAVTPAGAVMLGAVNQATGSDYGSFTLGE